VNLDAALLEKLPDLATRARVVAEGALAGLHPSVRRGPAPELVDRRAYVAGDDPRRIDWRVYARTRQLLVKQARRHSELPVHVVLDASASMGFRGPRAPRSKLDHARLLAAALAHLFLKAGDRVGLLAFGREEPRALAPAGGGRRRLVRISAELDHIEAGGAADAGHALATLRPLARRRGVVVLVSDLLAAASEARADDGLERTFRELRAFVAHGHDVLVVQVHDPAERALDGFPGSYRFVDPETGARREADVAAVARSYARRAEQFARDVREHARAARIDLALASTERSPVEPLAALVAGRPRIAHWRSFAA
jgi:uncharacterized protein (DUF58 family)